MRPTRIYKKALGVQACAEPVEVSVTSLRPATDPDRTKFGLSAVRTTSADSRAR